jgi:hypothetical protein
MRRLFSKAIQIKPFGSILLSALVTIVTFSVVPYMACHKDKCVDVQCLNKGVCDNGNCICLTGYEGPKCDTLSRNKFIFTFNGGDKCGTTHVYSQYPLKFTTIKNKPLEMKLKNLLNDANDSAVCTMQATDSFSFSGANSSLTYYGYGVLKHDTLLMSYHVQHAAISSYDCIYIGGR